MPGYKVIVCLGARLKCARKLAFDTISRSQSGATGNQASWNSSLREAPKEGAFQVPDAKTQQLMALKNSLASQVINNPALMDVASYFKVDPNRAAVR